MSNQPLHIPDTSKLRMPEPEPVKVEYPNKG